MTNGSLTWPWPWHSNTLYIYNITGGGNLSSNVLMVVGGGGTFNEDRWDWAHGGGKHLFIVM